MFDRVDENRMVGTIVWENDAGEEQETDFAVQFEVCGHCRGKGRHCNPAIDGHGLSREDFEEDPDFAEGYFSGRYDVDCEECHGQRVVPELAIDEENFTAEQKAAMAFAVERYRAAADDARTMRAECGGYG